MPWVAFIAVAIFGAFQVFPVRAEDCSVSVTGPDQPWTVSRTLHWKRSSAPSAQHSFSSPPPGDGEAVFSVMSELGSALQLRLFSAGGPGGYLITLSPFGWHVARTFVGTEAIMSSSPPSDVGRTSWDAVSGDAWTSYMLTVLGAEQLELERLWDNGTSTSILSLSDPKPLSVERVSMRVLEIDDGGAELPAKRTGDDIWSFWKFDCVSYFRQREPLCHVWPSWDGQVPRHFDLPSVRINPYTSISVHVRTSGIANLLLFETRERYYQITLSHSSLTLSKQTFGRMEEVARTCLSLPAEPGRFRLIWVSILVGFIQVGLGEPADVNRTCGEVPTTVSPFLVTLPDSRDEVDSSTQPASELAEAEEREEASVQSLSPALRNTFLRWKDAEALYVLSYGFRTREAQGRWTVDCAPQSGSQENVNTERKGTLNNRGLNSFRAVLESDGGPGERAGPPPAPPPPSQSSSPRYLIALIVLSVVSVLLLLLSAILVSDVIGRRRRQTARLDHDRRVSLAGEHQLGMAMGHEYAELMYDDFRPMNVAPGESTFKPIRRQETPIMPRRSPSPPFLPPPPEGM